MPAPTALKTAVAAPPADIPLPDPDQDEDLLLEAPPTLPTLPFAAQDPSISATDASPAAAVTPPLAGDDMQIDEEGRPHFAPESAVASSPSSRSEMRRIPVPPHRMTPLKQNWPKIYPPLVEQLKLQVRMNLKRKTVELRTSRATGPDLGAVLQKGEDFVRAFTLGFDVDDAVALLRLDDLYVETFEVKDVRTLTGDHLARAIGRIAGKDGKTKYAIENASRTRVVLADSKIHILGGFQNIHVARESIVSLILGKTPSKIHGNLRTVAARMKERF